MSHPTRSEVEQAVKLWRCDKKNNPACDATGMIYDCWNSHHRTLSEMCRLCTGAGREIVGFRMPPRCEDCRWCENCRWSSTLAHNETGPCNNYTPRQPGKGGAA